MNDETWVTLPDYPNYIISNIGLIYNVRHKRFLKQFYKFGYAHVSLYNSGDSKDFKVHRLVAICFIPNPYDLPQVNHIDGNKTNNDVSNLEWCTSSDNLRHAFHTGLKSPSNKRSVRIIETGDVFSSLTECARYIDGNPGNIRNCIVGRTKSHRGYTFEYISS